MNPAKAQKRSTKAAVRLLNIRPKRKSRKKTMSSTLKATTSTEYNFAEGEERVRGGKGASLKPKKKKRSGIS